MKIKTILLVITCVLNKHSIYSKGFPFFHKETVFAGVHVGYLNGAKFGLNVCSYYLEEGYDPWVLSIKGNYHLIDYKKTNSQSLEITLHKPLNIVGCGLMFRHYDGKTLTISPQFRLHAVISVFGQANFPVIRRTAYYIPVLEAGIEINLNYCSLIALCKTL